METTLDIILAIVVLAFIETLNAISPYLGFAVLVVTLLVGLATLVYTILKTYYLIKNKGK